MEVFPYGIWAEECGGLAPLGTQLLFLLLYLTNYQLEFRVDLRPPVIGEVAGYRLKAQHVL